MKLIYCIEDDNSTSEILICALKTVNYEVSNFTDNQCLMEKLKHTIPDLILLGTMAHEEDGTALLQNLKCDEQYINIPVIILSAASSEKVKVRFLDMGADDVLTRPYGMLELIARVNAVLRCSRKTAAEQRQIEWNGIFLDYSKRIIKYENNLVGLSYKEYELFYYLIINKGKVISRDKMINKIWESNKGKKRAVNMYISSIRHKLSEAGCHDIIKTVRSAGFKIDDA